MGEVLGLLEKDINEYQFIRLKWGKEEIKQCSGISVYVELQWQMRLGYFLCIVNDLQIHVLSLMNVLSMLAVEYEYSVDVFGDFPLHVQFGKVLTKQNGHSCD